LPLVIVTCAYVVLKKGIVADKPNKADELYGWVKERVAPYKRLDGMIVFREQFPKSASGKILRRLLRDEVAAST
jgi:4-coumarate--CoA ligase